MWRWGTTWQLLSSTFSQPGEGTESGGLREQGLPQCLWKPYIVAGAVQGAVVRDQEQQNQMSGSPRAWAGDPVSGLPSPTTHSSQIPHSCNLPPSHPRPPEAAMHVCPYKCPRTQGQFPEPMPHRKEAQAEKTGTPLHTTPSRWNNKSLPAGGARPLLPSSHPASPCPPTEGPGLSEPQTKEVDRAWGLLRAAAETRGPPWSLLKSL